MRSTRDNDPTPGTCKHEIDGNLGTIGAMRTIGGIGTMGAAIGMIGTIGTIGVPVGRRSGGSCPSHCTSFFPLIKLDDAELVVQAGMDFTLFRTALVLQCLGLRDDLRKVGLFQSAFGRGYPFLRQNWPQL